MNFDATPGQDAVPGQDAPGNPDALVFPDAGPPFDGGVLMGDPFNAQQLASQLSAAACAYRTRCEPAIYAFTGENEAACISETTANILATWNAYSQAVTAGRLAFNQAGFTSCVQAYNSSDCITGLPSGACGDMFRGNRPAGVGCSLSVECAQGNFCAVQALGQCGQCTPLAQIGQACDQAPCVPGSDCFVVDQQGSTQCLSVTIAENQMCGTVQTGLCQGLLQCVGPGMGPFTCRRPAGAGQTCDPNLEANPTCNIYQNQVCDPANTMCTMVSFVGVGQTCSAIQQCNSTGFCNDPGMTGMGTCNALPGAGQTCQVIGQDEICADGFACVNRVCTALAAQGQTCQTSNDCAGAYYCVNSVCGDLTHTLCN
jgi:hypothetical protein